MIPKWMYFQKFWDEICFDVDAEGQPGSGGDPQSLCGCAQAILQEADGRQLEALAHWTRDTAPSIPPGTPYSDFVYILLGLPSCSKGVYESVC